MKISMLKESLKQYSQIYNFKFILIVTLFVLDISIKITKSIRYDKNTNENIQKEFSNLEEYENERLLNIQAKIEGYIEITKDEQKFLNGLIRKIKPKKIVEIGVAYGGTAVVILNAIKDLNKAKLYSIDINKNCYKMQSKETGFIVNERFPELTKKWEKKTGGLTSEYIEKIGNEIDLVYIDTVHVTPGEMINWLEILPFLKEEAFVVLHDTFFMYFNNRIGKQIQNYSNNQILCYIRGELILPSYPNNTFSRNIGALKLNKNQNQYYFQYFLALGTQWQYMPSNREINILQNFFKKYYEKKYVKIFIDAVEKNKLRFKKIL